MRVVITIPAYNEERTLGRVLQDIHTAMKHTKYSYQVLVVDDGSTDNTAAVARKHKAKVYFHPKNYGLAEAFRTEMKQCLKMGADIIVHTDADGQYRPHEIPKLIKKVQEGYDLVLGSRFKGTIEYMPWIKRWGNKAFSRVISNITHTKISDGQTGFRAFTKEVAKNVKTTSNHTYTQEQIIRAIKEKYKIAEVPVYFAKRGGKTKSRLIKNPFEYAIKAWINILRIYRDYQPLRFFGLWGLLFFVAGLVLGVWIVYLFITTGRVGGIPRVILTALLLLTAVQIWLFGFLADMWRK